jgi:hypothetical protein
MRIVKFCVYPKFFQLKNKTDDEHYSSLTKNQKKKFSFLFTTQ